MPKALKIGVSVLVLGAALGYLMYRSMADNLEYYKQVDELAADLDGWTGVQVRLAGSVKEDSIFHRPGTHDYAFTVTHGGSEMRVAYSGRMPDGFTEKAEVVVSGRLGADGVFQGERVVAKCPSKYEAKDPRVENPPEGHAPVPSAEDSAASEG
ncbi:MAG: cytochrome c maturation protein CcmE [Myxococcota bacterium]